MGCYVISGGRELCGNIDIQGSKNSAVAVLIASLAVCGTVEISNLPDISDVHNCLLILEHLGCAYRFKHPSTVIINTENARPGYIPTSLLCEMRASGYLLGAELARFGRCEHTCSGGCDFGSRPMNFHFDALKALGASEEIIHGRVVLSTHGGLKGNEIILPFPSVGATVNAIICAVKAKGKTVIKNAAKEPHICDLACFLNTCGANIANYGTEQITIYGNRHLHGASFRLRGDMIEAGTYMLAPLICGGKVTFRDAPISDLKCLVELLDNIGASVSINNNYLTVSGGDLKSFNVTTAPYPGFPTDLHPQIAVLSSVCKGISSVTETVFGGRFAYLLPLKKMGMIFSLKGNKVSIQGNTTLNNASVSATDLRGGASLILASLFAKGESVINNAEFIDRGYSDVVDKLRGVGATIEYR